MGLTSRLRVVAIVLLVANCASAPIRERCGLLTVCVPPPRMTPELATIDQLLFQRAAAMAGTARALPNFMGDFYRREFLEQLLPQLCDRMEEARRLAGAGKTREAGVRYEGLAVAAEVMALEVALMQVADYADRAGAPGGLIVGGLQAYDRDMAPLMEAALSADRDRLKRALPEGERQYASWLDQLKRWEVSLKLGMERVEIAHKLWDLSLAVVATWEAAGIAAELAAGSGPPMTVGALAGSGGGAAVMVMDRAAFIQAAEALRKLVASGALDPAVVIGLVHMANGTSGPLVAPSPGSGETPAGPKLVGLGSTANPANGTRLPADLKEQLAIEEAMANPRAGKVVEDVELNDSRWPASKGWQKRQQAFGPVMEQPAGAKTQPTTRRITVHYVYNPTTNEMDDFKIVAPRTGNR